MPHHRICDLTAKNNMYLYVLFLSSITLNKFGRTQARNMEIATADLHLNVCSLIICYLGPVSNAFSRCVTHQVLN